MTEAVPFIRPEVATFLTAFNARPRPPMNDEGIRMMRQIPPELMAQMMQEIELPLGPLAVDRALVIPGPGGDLPARLFDARAEREPSPVVLFFHGGGFVTGSVATHAPLAAEIARALDLPVVSVEYRLAPEHKWPAAPDDAEAAARWIAANGAALGREVDGLVLSGDSAGGTLALVTGLALRDRPAACPARLLLAIYPMADASRHYPSQQQFADGYGLSSPDMAYYTSAYAPDPHSPRHSALVADLTGLPPVVVATASLDPLRDGGRALVGALAQAGVPVAFHEAHGSIHGYATYRRGIPSAGADLAAVLGLARAMLEPGAAA
ncbi:alpha/beta hydrolase [Novosphingobium aerophilum]|uniref:Alpha/beta hydrolase n=1 Tax=Novosphingobium aerophilum TaxID=2839843 RepID=A0A7X1F4U3_9SPHN|nr:alpha/beta hydrolase [Novosphingobium aerophilum]MBC2650411.1 alpha/beta hydrolase [Novosphingobium aerophilum]